MNINLKQGSLRLPALVISASAFAVSVLGVHAAAALADVEDCTQYAGSVVFGAGDSISGEYAAICSPSGDGTLYGRIKEDRTGLPDVVHDTEVLYFTGTGDQSTVDTVTCQDGDDIYIEADISGLSGTDQSDRSNMSC